MKKVVMCALALSLFAVESARAQGQADVDLYDLSLEELMNYTVVSATKTEVDVHKAPSVVRMFTQKDFEEFGFTRLSQVLESIPGAQVQNYRAGHQLLWIRGVQARYNNKVLLLIDGIPMRDGLYGNFLLDEMLPLQMVDKVEVLNGPGSVLYGANSFAGVINIVTKQKGRSAGVRYGSFNSKQAYAEADYGNAYGHVSYFNTDGFQPELMSNGMARTIDQQANGLNTLLKYQHKGLSFTGGYTYYSHPYTYRSTNKDYSFERAPLFGNLAYTTSLGENTQVSASAFMNRYNFSKHKTKFTDETTDELKETSIEEVNTLMQGLELNMIHALGNHQLTMGLSAFRDKALDPREIVDYSIKGPEKEGIFPVFVEGEIDRTNLGVYLQDVFQLTDHLAVTSGIRYERLSDFDDQLNYRIALTGQTEKNLYGKLLYGTAYRMPSYREYLTVDAPNPALQPEQLATLEAQMGYKLPFGNIDLTFYRNRYTNFINEVIVDSIAENGTFIEIDDEMAFNFDSRTISGLELNGRIMPSKKLIMNVGLGFILNATETMGELPAQVYTSQPVVAEQQPLYFLSRFTANSLISYKLTSKLKVGTQLLYHSQRNTPANYQAGVPSEVQNPANANGFMRWNLNASFNPTKKLSLKAQLHNVLDAAIYSPPYGGAEDYDVAWPGRTFAVEARYRF